MQKEVRRGFENEAMFGRTALTLQRQHVFSAKEKVLMLNNVHSLYRVTIEINPFNF